MSKDSPKIASFAMTGLFGNMNVEIPFESPIKILVSENGFGKTTVLNSLYFTLTKRLNKLAEIPFKTIMLTFTNGTAIELRQDDIHRYLSTSHGSSILEYLRRRYGHKRAKSFLDALLSDSIDSPLNSRMLRELRSRFRFPSQMALINNIKKEMSEDRNMKLEAQLDLITANFSMEYLYLPTYRRIEEDLSNLSMVSDDYENIEEQFDLEEGVIQFGMQDVVGRINELIQEIREASVIGFQAVNGQMLNQLVSESQLDNEKKGQLKDITVIELVLDRIGSSIDDQTKERILDLLMSDTLFDGHHNTLAIFLSNLREVYEDQKSNDNALKEFTEICNKYLVNKEILYDESSVQVKILSSYDQRDVEFQHLSSGEKQIISLFSKLFLSKQKEFAVFFDEPELSLSIEWQKEILPDIMKSGKCGFLIATTHSPFIFENDLKQFTTSLREYITR